MWLLKYCENFIFYNKKYNKWEFFIVEKYSFMVLFYFIFSVHFSRQKNLSFEENDVFCCFLFQNCLDCNFIFWFKEDALC